MATTQRKPTTFDINGGGEPAPSAPTAPKQIAGVPAIKRQHIGARVPQDKYRQLKAHAVLTGIPVQALVEKIVDQYLARLPKEDRASVQGVSENKPLTKAQRAILHTAVASIDGRSSDNRLGRLRDGCGGIG